MSMKHLSHFLAAAILISLILASCGGDEPAPPTQSSSDPKEEEVILVPSQGKTLYDVRIPSTLASQIKEYTGFTLSYNKENKTPNYVAWELLGAEVSTEWPRTDNFWQDPDIIGCTAHRDYTNSGYDRGHMCPAADQKWSEQAMIDCFVMANMCPQLHALNAGAWETLENKEREWAKRDSAIMIIAGPIYNSDNNNYYGNAKVRIPDAFFKVLAVPYLDNPRGIAFVYPNMNCPGNMQDYATSIDKVEELVGFDFLSSLPDDIESHIESSYSFPDWNN